MAVPFWTPCRKLEVIITFRHRKLFLLTLLLKKKIYLLLIYFPSGGRLQDIFVQTCTQRNIIKSNRNQIVFTIFRLNCNQTDVHLVPNQLETGKYNLISVWFNKISKRFLCVRQGNSLTVVFRNILIELVNVTLDLFLYLNSKIQLYINIYIHINIYMCINISI